LRGLYARRTLVCVCEDLHEFLGFLVQFGEVERMTLFSKHEDGVIMVRYKSAGAAAAALSAFDKRWFGGRQLHCNYWDGSTDYRYAPVRSLPVWLHTRTPFTAYIFLCIIFAAADPNPNLHLRMTAVHQMKRSAWTTSESGLSLGSSTAARIL
jgi:hypothetical protein